MTNEVIQSPPVSSLDRIKHREKVRSRTRLDLWKAIWEASQFMNYDEMKKFMAEVWIEIETDEP